MKIKHANLTEIHFNLLELENRVNNIELQFIMQKADELQTRLTKIESLNFNNVQNKIVKVIMSTTKMATPSPPTTSTIKATTTTTTIAPTPINLLVPNWNQEYYETIIDMLSDINVCKIWIITIACGLLFMITMKLINLCEKGFKIHNEKVISRHTRVSPQI